MLVRRALCLANLAHTQGLDITLERVLRRLAQDLPFSLQTLALLFMGMSALGQKQTFEPASAMSALPPKADILKVVAGTRSILISFLFQRAASPGASSVIATPMGGVEVEASRLHTYRL